MTMRAFDNGSLFTVACTADDMERFATRWPCFGSRRPIAFTFEKRTGDLVDISRDTSANDAAGIQALAADAEKYGRAALARRARRFDPFAPVSGTYGAPMGRHSHPGTASTWTPETRLVARHQGGADGYDKGGAYWGTSPDGPVWAVWKHGHGENGVVYVRAHSKAAAISAALAD